MLSIRAAMQVSACGAAAQVFVANPNKTQEITELLQHNKDKLLRYLGDFHTDKGGSRSCQHSTLLHHWCRASACSEHQFLAVKKSNCGHLRGHLPFTDALVVLSFHKVIRHAVWL